MGLAELDQKLKHSLRHVNLENRLPGYVCKPVFIVFFVGIVGLYALAFYLGGPSVTVSCDSSTPCANPLFPCSIYASDKPCQLPNKKHELLCPDDICKIEILPAGYVYEKRNLGVDYLNGQLVVLVAIALLLNHIVFMLNYRKLYPTLQRVI